MASIPYNFEFDRDYAFMLDPNAHNRVGYVTKLNGLGLTSQPAPDLTVSVPYSGRPAYPDITLKQPSAGNLHQTATVVGVLEKLSWPGGVGDAIHLDFWVSQENAVKLKEVQQTTLMTTKVDSLAWWAADYDQETKLWYEQAFPLGAGTINGLITGKENPELNVDLTPVPARDGIDVMIYKVSLQVAPGANQQFMLHFANSATTPTVKQWGIDVGTLAAEGVKPAQP
jgi:hypothetical protein